MKRPFIPILLFFIFGTIFGRYFADGVNLFLVYLGIAAVLLYFHYRRLLYAAFPLFSLLGFFLVCISLAPGAELREIAESGVKVRLDAVVLESGMTSSGKLSLIAAARGGKIYIIDGQGRCVPGDRISFEAELLPPEGPRNPGGFDSVLFLRSKKADYSAYPDTLEITGKSFVAGSILNGLKIAATKRLNAAFDAKQAGIMKALVLGDKSGLDPEDRQLYRDIGIYHILAVSGLHITILATGLNALLLLFLKRKQAAAASAALVIFYTVFTGAGIATVRACIMFTASTLAVILQRDRDSLNFTALAALILLIYEPFYLWNAGFQYSFAVVFSLLLLSPAVERAFLLLERFALFRKILRLKYIKTFLAPAAAAALASYPITMYYFGEVSLISVFSNLLIVPSVFITVLSGFAVCLFGGAAALFSLAGSMMLSLYEFAGLLLRALPFANVVTGRPSLLFIAAFYALLALFVYLMRGGREVFTARITAFSAGLAVFAVITAIGMIPPGFSITMLDVGQGDCTVVENKNTVIVIDGGGNGLKPIGANTGETVLLPYLNYKGVNRVDAAFISHADSDHAIGIIELLGSVKVDSLYVAEGTQQDTTLYGKLIESAQKNGCAVRYIKTGDIIEFPDGIFISCIHPNGTRGGGTNDDSSVLKLSFGELDALFTGDISSAAEAELIRKNRTELDCEILKLAHHGSKYSNSEAFITAASPELALVGTGRNNGYGHPSPAVTERLADKNISLYDTSRCGAIIITFDKSVLNVKTMLK